MSAAPTVQAGAIVPVDSRVIEWHQLSMPFAPLRIQAHRVVDQLARSIEQHGQLVPVVAVTCTPQWVLIDGYRRCDALHRCGHDQIWAELWNCELASGVLRVLARGQGRTWQPLEEAGVIRELIECHALSQREIARRSGRDVSWVSRRLALIGSLPEPVLAAVRQGRLASWVASRVLVPLARANTAHALGLLAALEHEAFSARELQAWFEHYQHTNSATREQLAQTPALFIKAWRERQRRQQAEQLAQGPQGRWLADLRQVRQLCQRLREQLPRAWEPTLPPDQRQGLLASFARTEQHFGDLVADLEPYRQ